MSFRVALSIIAKYINQDSCKIVPKQIAKVSVCKIVEKEIVT